MKVNEEIKSQDIDLQADVLTDLSVAKEHAGEARGGVRRSSDPVEFIVVGSGAGGGPLAQ